MDLTAKLITDAYSKIRDQASQFVLSDAEQTFLFHALSSDFLTRTWTEDQWRNVNLFASDHWTAALKTAALHYRWFAIVAEHRDIEKIRSWHKFMRNGLMLQMRCWQKGKWEIQPDFREWEVENTPLGLRRV